MNDEDDCIWTDIAGLLDSGGDLIQFINSFLNKKIFSLVKEVKFLVPFTVNQIREQRGQSVREQISTIMRVCKGCDLNKVIESIQPLITKVKVTDQDFDLECARSEIF